MATNSIGGVNLARISQRSLDALITQLIPLANLFMTDFSSEVARGPSITTRYAVAPVVKTLLTLAQRVSDNSTIVPVVCNIGSPRGVDIGFNDVEMINSEIQLQKLFIIPAITAIIEDIMASVFALVTAANYTQSVIYAAAAYDADAVSAIAEALSTAKVPMMPRSAVIKPTYFGNLSRDNAIQAAYAYGSRDVILNNEIPKVHGIGQYQFNGTIPNNGENLAGFVTGPQGIILCARAPITPQNWYGEVHNVTEPITGLALQFRYFYDGAEHRLQVMTQSGAAVGNPGNLVRIKSA